MKQRTLLENISKSNFMIVVKSNTSRSGKLKSLIRHQKLKITNFPNTKFKTVFKNYSLN